MDDADLQMEQITNKFSQDFSSRVTQMDPVEISLATNKENELPPAIDLHESKMRLLQNLQTPLPIPRPYSFSQKILDNLTNSIDLPTDTANALSKFYNEEVQRVTEKYAIITKRCNEQENFVDVIPQLSLVVESVSNYIMKCKDTISRLGPSMLTSFTCADIKSELQQKFYRKMQHAFVDEIVRTIEMFPFTRRRSIYKTFSNKVIEMFYMDRNSQSVANYISKEDAMDEKIHRLAKLFCIDQNIELNDGQSFTYHCDKLLYTLSRKLTLNDIPRRSIEVTIPPAKVKQHELIYNSIIAALPEDHKVTAVLDRITSLNDYQVVTNLKEQASFYNSFVGNGLFKKRLDLPQYKIYTMLELRCIHIKFLWEMLVHYINYFQYVRYSIANPSGKYRAKQSKRFKEFIEVWDEGGPFIFQSTDSICKEIKGRLSRICGFFIAKGEAADKKFIDRENVVEKILEFEVELCASKVAVISPLLEILDHKRSQAIIEQIHETINVMPLIDTTLIYSFESPYKILTQSLKLQAKMMRQLVNAQVIHLRHVATSASKDIPIFDKPEFIPCPIKMCLQAESVKISLFEVYEALEDVGNVCTTLQKLIPEFIEDVNIKGNRFWPYMSYSIWHELDSRMSNMFTRGVFPFDSMRTYSELHYSDSVNTLFSSRFLNSIEPLEDLIDGMRAGKQMKVLISARRLFNFAWNLQKEIVKTNDLQRSYLQQCKTVGSTDIAVQLAPYTNARAIGSQDTMPEDIIEFALSEFNPVGIDFCNITYIKDILFSGNMQVIDELYRAQKQQNMYLETAVRYNDFMLDTYQMVDLFQLISFDATNIFVTGSESNEALDTEASVYDKQFVARFLFFEHQNMTNNIATFKNNYINYFLNIKVIKQEIRSGLASHLKHCARNSPETKSLYFSELVDAFSSYMYRIEIARICNNERRILLTNSFVDTFLLGPLDGQTFVNEAGRFENFFYVPSWTEVFGMMRSSGLPRQSAVLKWIVPFLVSRLRILCYVRYIACIEQKSEVIFESLANQNMTVETTILQKLLNEFQRLPNARDIDVLAGFVHDKELYFYRLFELTLLSTFNTCFTSLKSESSASGMQKKIIASGTKELKFGEIIKELIFSIHQPLPEINSSSRYIPEWQNEFAFRFNQESKQELAKQLFTTENYVETSLATIKNQSYMDSFQMVQPMTEFAEMCISMNFLKYAYFQALCNVDYKKITPMSAVLNLNQSHYMNGEPIWNDVILKESLQKITPTGDPLPKKIPPASIPKYNRQIVEVVADHFETTINEQQAKFLQNQCVQILSGLHTKKADVDTLRPDTFMITIKQSNKDDFLITPGEANTQFLDELSYSKASIISCLYDIFLKSKRGSSNSTSFTIDEDKLKSKCACLSDVISLFMSSSLHDAVTTWKQYNFTAIKQMQLKIQREESLKSVEEFNRKRNKSETAAEIAAAYENEIHKVNELEDKKNEIVKGMSASNMMIEKEIRVEYDKLVSDLRKRIVEEKNTFIIRKKKIYQMILDVLKKEHTLESGRSTKQSGKSAEDNQKILDRMESENKAALKKIKMLRIIRAFSNIAMRKSFARKLLSAEGDRKMVNASLWSNRLTYEMHGADMEDQLQQAQDRLTESEYELERVKHSLELEKSSNIDMVQWKATNSNRIDVLKKEIERVKMPKDAPNINKLLSRLDNAQDQLESLISDNEQLDVMKEDVDRTIKKTERVRTAMARSRLMQLETLQNACLRTDEDDAELEKNQKYQALLNENDHLRRRNNQLKREIQIYMEQIRKYPSQTIKLMERTAAASRPRTSAIVRPSTKASSRSFGSRTEMQRKKILPNIFI